MHERSIATGLPDIAAGTYGAYCKRFKNCLRPTEGLAVKQECKRLRRSREPFPVTRRSGKKESQVIETVAASRLLGGVVQFPSGGCANSREWSARHPC